MWHKRCQCPTIKKRTVADAELFENDEENIMSGVCIFTPRRGRVRPHQGHKHRQSKDTYAHIVVVVVVALAPGQIFCAKNIPKLCI